MGFDFDEAIRVGEASDLIEIQRGIADVAARIPSSKTPRGLAMKSLHVTHNWDGLWGLLRRRQQIYFLSVSFDLSKHAPVVLPPKEVPAEAVHEVRRREAIQFSLGDGAPIFPPRVIDGGLVTYITICEADKGIKHVGEVLAQVHEDVAEDGSLGELVGGLIKNPGEVVAAEIVKVAAAALRPVATILSNARDEYVGVMQGIFPAKGPWEGKLVGASNGTTIELVELR